MTKQSGNHAAASLSDGTWSCEHCGAESLDFDMFEEAGAFEGCLDSACMGGSIGGNGPLTTDEVERAKAWITKFGSEMKKSSDQARRTSEMMSEFTKKLLDQGHPVPVLFTPKKTEGVLDAFRTKTASSEATDELTRITKRSFGTYTSPSAGTHAISFDHSTNACADGSLFRELRDYKFRDRS